MIDHDAAGAATAMPRDHRPRAATIRPPAASALIAAILVIPIASLTHHSGAPVGAAPVIVAVFAAASGAVIVGLRRGYPHATLGACNAVTQVRMALVAIVAVPILAPATLSQHPTAFFAVAALALALDGLDGWLARRSGLRSAFGARFDMEVDAAFAAVLALVIMRSDEVQGAVALVSLAVLGFSRYAFVVASLALPVLRGDLPELWSRKMICVIQIATLVALLLPEVGGVAAATMTVVTAGLLAWSFGRDIVWLVRGRG